MVFYDRVLELIDADRNLTTTNDKSGVTLLHWAALNDRIEIAKLLINRGAEVDAIGGTLKSTPLFWAIREGKTANGSSSSFLWCGNVINRCRW